MQPSEDDNTAVIRMKRDFNSFLHGSARGNKPANVLDFGHGGSFIADTTPSSRADRSLSTSSISMQQLMDKEREGKKKEVEMIRAKTYITQLESKVNSLEASRKRARVDYEKECEILKQEAEKEKDKMAQIRHQFNLLGAKEHEAKETIAELREELVATKSKLEQKILQLQKDKTENEHDLQEENMRYRQKVSDLKRELLRLQAEHQISQTDAQECREQLTIANKRCADVKEQLKNLEEKGMEALDAQIKIKSLEQQLEQVQSDAIVTSAMKSKLEAYRELEVNNQKLLEQNQYYRDMQENVALLREEKEHVKRQLQREKEKTAEMAKLQVANDELRQQLTKWSTTDEHGNVRPMSPSKLTRRITDLQSTNALLLEKQGKLQASANSVEQQLQRSEREVTEVKRQLSNQTKEVQQLKDYVKRAQRKINLVTKERDNYRDIIQTFENEMTVTIGASTLPNKEGERLKQLEDILDGYKKQCSDQEKELAMKVDLISQLQAKVAELQNQVQLQQSQSGRVGVTSEADQKIILDLREKVEHLEKEMQEVVEQKENLEDRIEKRHLEGDYDPRRTKVLHFSMNPFELQGKQRAEELKRLKEENAKLKARVEVLESGEGQSDVTMKVEQKVAEPSTSEEVQEMKKELEKVATKNKRLMEAFKKTSQEVREVCYQLLGYRLDIPCLNQYKLMSMYSETPEDYFLFKLTSDGSMQMLSTDFSSQPSVADKIDTYLSRGNSIPAFLSSVTIDLFSRQTMMA